MNNEHSADLGRKQKNRPSGSHCRLPAFETQNWKIRKSRRRRFCTASRGVGYGLPLAAFISDNTRATSTAMA
jgi:hypothetical protein